MKATQALAAYRKVGASRATGPTLAACYGGLLSDVHGGSAERYTAHLLKLDGDEAIHSCTKTLLDDRAAAWDVLMGI